MSSHSSGDRAIVIGGSIAGLLAARVLADRFDRVTIIERDRLPQDPIPRPGVPQARHAHALLKRGRDILEELFPGFEDDLVAAGAHLVDMAADFAWLTPAGWGVRFPSNLRTIFCSRSLLEWYIRQRVSALPQIEFLQGYEVKHLLPNEDNTGVAGTSIYPRHRSEVENSSGEQLLSADFVVDASGRRSKAPQWLEMLGYPAPQETVVNAHLGYASRLYQLPSDFQADWRVFYVQAAPPTRICAAMFLPIEGNRWLFSLGGGDRNYPPTDEAGFLEFVRSNLPTPLLYEVIKAAEPLSPIYSFRATENRLRHYEQLPRWPESLVILGDAVCTFNPVYGQGMTIAALGALTLEQCLQEQRKRRPEGSLTGMSRRFQKQLAKVNAAPWQLATSEDYRYRSTVGGSPSWSMQLMHRYMDRVILLATESVQVRRLLLDVFNLLQPSTALFHPRIIIQVIFQAFKSTFSPLNRELATNASHIY